MPHPAVFVSYSHKDEVWKDRLVQQLRVLEPEGDFEVWDDRRITAGSDWFPEIEQAMNRAVAAVLLISADFLTSPFILSQEVPPLLERRAAQGLLVIPVIVRPCAWQRIKWLSPIQCRPKDGAALSGGTDHQVDTVLSELTIEIQDLLARAPRAEDPSSSIHLDIDRLPRSGPLFVGREAEIQRLQDAWENTSAHILTFIAPGGVGKSALVGRWLDDMAAAGWRGARRVLAWSFYSQGTADRVLSAEPFLDYALSFFGDPDFTGAPRDRGLRLAELVRREKTLLVLDGIEPLQHPPGPLAGQLKDPGLAALLKSLAAGNSGLCVVTTRERIADLHTFPKSAPQVDLKTLSQEAGAELLRQLGVQGKDSELRAAAGDFGGHSLALTLLGTYLRDICKGDVRRRKEVPLLDEGADEDGHARRVLSSYAAWLQEPELEVLRLLGFFDRTATPDLVAALRAEPAIVGLTEHIGPQEETRFQKAVARLRKARLLDEGEKPGSLDAHPLVRVYFQEELERDRPTVWQEGNLRLYVYLKGAAPELPETLEAMEPLYTAVLHGCRAGRQQESIEEVYSQRIQRGDEFYSSTKLGAFGSDLAALAGFFDRRWDQPSGRLGANWQAFVLHQAAYCLRALGRLAEAVELMQAALSRVSSLGDLKNTASYASNISTLMLTLGEIRQAVFFGEQSVALADGDGDISQRKISRAVLAHALHHAGLWEESAEVFREADAIQGNLEPLHYTVSVYRYCDLLLSRGEPESGAGLDGLTEAPEERRRCRQACREAQERVQRAGNYQGSTRLLAIALNQLTLGWVQLGLSLTAEVEADFTEAAHYMDRAVEWLRKAGQELYLPRGLLGRAALHRLQGNSTAALVDLSEALEIAERDGMRLYACDAHLERARLDLQQGDTAAARAHVTAARQLVNETGYKRREREVAWLERRVGVPGSAGVSPAG